MPEPSADLLDDDHIDDFCRLHRWSYDGTALMAQVEAPTFLHGINDVTAIARVAERWTTIRISTSDGGTSPSAYRHIRHTESPDSILPSPSGSTR